MGGLFRSVFLHNQPKVPADEAIDEEVDGGVEDSREVGDVGHDHHPSDNKKLIFEIIKKIYFFPGWIESGKLETKHWKIIYSPPFPWCTQYTLYSISNKQQRNYMIRPELTYADNSCVAMVTVIMGLNEKVPCFFFDFAITNRTFY